MTPEAVVIWAGRMGVGHRGRDGRQPEERLEAGYGPRFFIFGEGFCCARLRYLRGASFLAPTGAWRAARPEYQVRRDAHSLRGRARGRPRAFISRHEGNSYSA